jgi:hypothetical protein
MRPQPAPAIDRYSLRIFQAVLVIGLACLLGLSVDGALLIGNFRLGQAALQQAALAAAGAVDEIRADGATTPVLRLAEAPGRPSAYTLAQKTLDDAGVRQVTLTDVVSDGGQVLVRGVVASPTFFARLFGVSDITFSLVATAELRPLPIPAAP